MKYASIPGDSSIKNIMPARIKVQSGVAMAQKRKSEFWDDEITGVVEDAEARKRVLINGLNRGLTDKAKRAVWEHVVAAGNEVGQRERTVAHMQPELQYPYITRRKITSRLFHIKVGFINNYWSLRSNLIVRDFISEAPGSFYYFKALISKTGDQTLLTLLFSCWLKHVTFAVLLWAVYMS